MRRWSMTGTGRCLDAECRMSVALVRRVGERATGHIDEEGEVEEHWRTVTGEKTADEKADIAVPWSKSTVLCSHGGKNHDPLEKDGLVSRGCWRWPESRKMAVETQDGCGDNKTARSRGCTCLQDSRAARKQGHDQREEGGIPGDTVVFFFFPASRDSNKRDGDGGGGNKMTTCWAEKQPSLECMRQRQGPDGRFGVGGSSLGRNRHRHPCCGPCWRYSHYY